MARSDVSCAGLWKGGIACLLLAALGTIFAALAQDIRGTLQGRVTDPSGASVPGAKVVVTNQATNVAIEAVTNLEGNYVIAFLTPGVYSLRVEREGFNKLTRPNVTLQTQERLTIDFTLTPGSLTETVTVMAEPPMLQTASADFGQVMDTRFLNRLPVVGMNPLAVADMAPGVVPITVSSITDFNSSYVRINGSSGTGNQMTVDGAPADVPRMSGVSYVFPMAQMVEELKIVTAVFDAAQGRTNGGSILVATKTGTNQLHGSAYYNFRDERFNANSWTNKYFGTPRGQENFWIAGATANGPVIKNRTFFSAGIEKQRNIRSQNWNWRVPTELERKGDFSQTLSPSGQPLRLYDPLTTVMSPSGTFVSREVFPNAMIPSSRINEVGAAVASQYPKPNFFGNPNQLGVVNYATAVIVSSPYLYFQSRIDHNLNEKHRLYGRFARNIGDVNKVDFNNLPINAYTGHFTQSRRAYHYVLEDTATLRPTLVATFRVAFNRFNQHVFGHGDNLDPSLLKLPDVLKGQAYSGGGKGWPRWVVNDGAVPVMGPGFRASVNNVLSGSAGFNAFWSNHNFRWGAEYRDTRWNENNPGTTQNGQFTFDKHLTRANDNNASNNTSGSGMASLLLGLPTAGLIQRSAAAAGQSSYTALYVQDDYRLHPKLALSLGLRWEIETPFTERYDRMFYDFSPAEDLGITVPGVGALKGGVRFVNTGGLPRRQGELDRNNFGPRVGIAYTVDSKTVVRAAWGLVYEGLINNLTDQLALPYIPASYTFGTNYVGSGDGNRTVLPGVSLSNPFPNGFNPIIGNSLGNKTQLGDSIAYINPKIRLPGIHQIQFTVQRQLPWSSLAEIAYVGVRYDDLFWGPGYNLNEVPDAYRTQDQPVSNPFRGILPATSSRGAAATISANQLKTRFPQFTSVTEYNTNGPWGRYHALQARWEKRLSHGVQIVANYTFSKNMEFTPQSVVNDRFYKTVTASDRPHLGRIFFTGDLPFGKNRWRGNTWPGWLQQIAGGWSLSWAFKYATGAPLGLTGPNGRPIPLAHPATGASVHDCLGTSGGTPCLDITKIQPLFSQYDITPEPERYSWLRGPNRISHDAVFFKEFRIAERFAFDLRAETLNVFNSPLWGDPETGISNSTTFGRILTGENPRSFRLTGRITF
ncbi:MAG: carboxypeptidase regulatory-like domain-containing protein [Bacteroidota bacterium]